MKLLVIKKCSETHTKRAKTDEERLKSVDCVRLENSDTKVMCLRCHKSKATYHKYQKVLDGKFYVGMFCIECHNPSPLTAEEGYQEV